LPFFLISLCKYFDVLSFGNQFDWLGGEVVLIILGVATLVEIVGYYIPLVDHILDIAATPLAFAAGIVSMSSVMPDMPVYFDNILSIIIGGGTAVSINGIMGLWRVKTTASTFGVASPVFSTFENIFSIGFTILAFLIPVIFGLFITMLVICSFRFVRKLFYKRKKVVPVKLR
jgi:hypothetical protein